mgnify:CR=1 FL=1
MRKFSLPICFLVTLIIAAALELTKIWMLLIIAGIIGGFLSKSFIRAVIAGGLGLLVCWLLYLGIYYALNPTGMSIAISIFSLFLVLVPILSLILGVVSASVGYFLSQIVVKKPPEEVKA